MGALHRYAEHLARQHVGGAVGSADVGGARAAQAAVRPVSTAQAELCQDVVAAGQPQAGGLGGDQGLVVEGVEHRRLQELSFDERTLDLQDGLMGEDDCALRDGLDGAGRPEIAQIVEKGGIEGAQPGQIVQVLLGETQVVDQVQ